VLGGRESRSIKFSMGACFDPGSAVGVFFRFGDVDCGSLAVLFPSCGKILAIARI
jgi:hypothetical protein